MKLQSKEDAAFDREGFYRYNIRKSCAVFYFPHNPGGPRMCLTNRPR